MANQYCVTFRTGGPDRFKWKRSMPFSSVAYAHSVKLDVERMGYLAYIEAYVPRAPVPKTWDAPAELILGEPK